MTRGVAKGTGYRDGAELPTATTNGVTIQVYEPTGRPQYAADTARPG